MNTLLYYFKQKYSTTVFIWPTVANLIVMRPMNSLYDDLIFQINDSNQSSYLKLSNISSKDVATFNRRSFYLLAYEDDVTARLSNN